MQVVFVFPAIVPISILRKLSKAGIHSAREVHRYIKAGTLQKLPGIGCKTERKIVRYYTAAKREITVKEFASRCKR